MVTRCYEDDDREAASHAAKEIFVWLSEVAEDDLYEKIASWLGKRDMREVLQDIILKHMGPVKSWTAYNREAAGKDVAIITHDDDQPMEPFVPHDKAAEPQTSFTDEDLKRFEELVQMYDRPMGYDAHEIRSLMIRYRARLEAAEKSREAWRDLFSDVQKTVLITNLLAYEADKTWRKAAGK